ncbi:MAG: dehydrogenase, partial [Paenibacillus sp.]|nr:dehydrogenase [Paenibacillus sp.]
MKKVRAAVIGLGSWGVCHLEAYLALPYVEVKAICDIREEAVIAAGERYGIQDLYTDPTVLLERDDIDVVSIVTSESEHLA